MAGLFERTMQNGARALSRGDLAVAAAAFELAGLELPPESGPAQAAALQLARAYLDAGDGPRLAALLERWVPHARGATALAWRLIEAERRFDQGELTRAADLLDAVAEAAEATPHAEAARAEALELRAFVLAALNRLEEAEALDRASGGAGGVVRFAHDRRDGVDPWRWSVPSPEATLRGAAPPSPRPAVTSEAEVPALHALLPAPQRRARRWWAALYNLVLHDLHRGDVATAQRRTEALRDTAMRSAAPPLDARRRQTVALVLHARGERERALPELDAALDDFLAAGALLDAWNVARLALLCLAPDDVAARSRWGRTAHDLLACITRALSPDDAALFLLTRTGAIDGAIAAACTAAASGADPVAALHAVQEARWPTGSPPSPRPANAARGDVFARAEEHLRLRGRHPADALTPAAIPEGTVVVVQVVLDDRVGAFLVTRRACAWIEDVPCTRASLRTLVARSLVTQRTRRGAWRPDDASARLAQVLGLERACAEEGARRVVIVPDDAGLHVPYALLPLADGCPLGRRLATALLCTPRVRERPRELRPLAVGVAAPHTGGQAPLPHSLEEVRQALERARGDRRVISSREEALAALPLAHTAHFACHGLFDASDPWRAALLLHDGPLSAEDVAALDLRGLDVAFLSACWQGGAAALPGREAAGMPMAFLAAGAGAVVAPLWEGFDLAGPSLAARYHAARATVDAAEALWVATRDALAAAPRTEGAWRVFVSTLRQG